MRRNRATTDRAALTSKLLIRQSRSLAHGFIPLSNASVNVAGTLITRTTMVALRRNRCIRRVPWSALDPHGSRVEKSASYWLVNVKERSAGWRKESPKKPVGKLLSTRADRLRLSERRAAGESGGASPGLDRDAGYRPSCSVSRVGRSRQPTRPMTAPPGAAMCFRRWLCGQWQKPCRNQ
jgi:hypothetical protein